MTGHAFYGQGSDECGGQDFLCYDCAMRRPDATEGGNRLLYLWWTGMPDSMEPIALVMDTPERPLPNKPSTEGLGTISAPQRVGTGGGGKIMRFRVKKRAAQCLWESLGTHGY